MYNFDAAESIKKRISVRTYSKQAVEPEKQGLLASFIENNAGNPFGASARLAILGTQENPRLGAYGFIRGAKAYIAGCVKKGEGDIEGFGYEMERAILYAASLGLGTCWIGGLFTRGSFSAALKPEGEYMPAVSALGYAAQKRSIMDRTVASAAGSRKRMPFGELFFDGQWGNPIKADEKTSLCLEMVRIAPSASNKQPWRVIRNDTGLHFYLMADEKYAGNKLFGFCMQRLDMGIAACHFELSARQCGLNGAIAVKDPHIKFGSEIKPGLSYSFTWL